MRDEGSVTSVSRLICAGGFLLELMVGLVTRNARIINNFIILIDFLS